MPIPQTPYKDEGPTGDTAPPAPPAVHDEFDVDSPIGSPPPPHHRIGRRDRRMTIYQSREDRPRWVLHMQAVFWRVLMGLGMFFHRLAPPRPPKHDFSRTIPSTLGARPGSFTLHFYLPLGYETEKALWSGRPVEDFGAGGGGEEDAAGRRLSKRLSAVSNVGQSLRRRRMSSRMWGRYPVIINFHGGGFTLGSAFDDARWCGTVVDECCAVVVSVDYRLAPECPFPTAVEDGADAVLYIYNHADELGIDRDKIALSGFSSGANMAFTVPLRLHDQLSGFPRDDTSMYKALSRQVTQTSAAGISRSTTPVPQTSSSADHASSPFTTNGVNSSRVHLLDPNGPPPVLSSNHHTKQDSLETVTEAHRSIPDIKIRCIVPWYPPVDYTRTREQRRATCVRKDQELPAIFTDLFDESYLYPPHTIALDSPYLSPGIAPTDLLRDSLPQDILLNTCEWDMLLDEGQAFRDRLVAEPISKNVIYHMIPNAPHGWDKAPNPWKPTPGVREHYLRVCAELRNIMGPLNPGGRPLIERETSAGPSAAPRGSVALVR